MTSKYMYFGTKERMSWVKMPAINAGLSRARWSAEGVYLNGGAFVQRSSAAHMRYEFAWNLAPHEDIYEITAYDDGVYGSDLIYFVEPFSASINCLPQFWAAPRLQEDGAPSLVKGTEPTLVDTASNDYAYPGKSAVFDLGSTSEFATIWLPVPPGYTLHFGVHGNATGTAAVTVQEDGGAATNVTMLATTTSTLTNVEITGPSGVTISATGEGLLTIAGMIAQILPTGTAAPTGRFWGGRGHSGCRFSGNGATVTGYSSPAALDLVSASATLIEVGAWEQ